MKRAFGRILGESLDNSNGQTIFSSFESKNLFAGLAALFLFPLKDFLDVRVLDYRNALVEIEKPLNYVGNGINVNVPAGVALQGREFRGGVAVAVCCLRTAIVCSDQLSTRFNLNIRRNFTNNFSVSITHGKESVTRNSLERFIIKHTQLSERLNYDCRSRAMIVTIFNLQSQS